MIDERSLTGRAVVIGAGTMGGGIAAQLANAGWQVDLLDVAGSDPQDPLLHNSLLYNPLLRDPLVHNQAAIRGLERLVQHRPPLLALPDFASSIRVGNTADDLDRLRNADWVVEAVAERMDIKRELLAQVEAHVGAQTLISSNTSGLSLSGMVAGRSPEFRGRFFGTHFLNPPRYLKLLELTPTSETGPEILVGFLRFAEQVLGHRVVITKDTPGFVSTRIWIEHLVESMRLAIEQGLTVEETDYLTGSLLGRPRSATFRMADLVGLDIITAIAGNQAAALPDDPFRDRLQLPAILPHLIAEGHMGDKTGAGFYRRDGKTILALDLTTGEYRPREEVRIDAVEALLKLPLAERLSALNVTTEASRTLNREINGALNPKIETEVNTETRWGRFVVSLLDALNAYVEYVGPLVASDTLSVDNVMRWGFQWELGPYEIDDLRTGQNRHYSGIGANRQMRVFGLPDMQLLPPQPAYRTLTEWKALGALRFETPVGALLDLGDGVACLELYTRLNTFDPALCDLIQRARETVRTEFAALVIGTDAPHFSAGYNLKLLLNASLTADWETIDAMLYQVQTTFQGLKYAPFPIVAAIRGYALGAGCECALHCTAIQASQELTMGLPELAAGLVPSGGGVKELLARAMSDWDRLSDPFPYVETVFGQIVENGNSSSAQEAQKFGLLRPTDGISRNADRLLHDARNRALALANAGYSPPEPVSIPVPGGATLARLRQSIYTEERFQGWSDYDRHIAEQIALILCGGESTHPREVTEQALLDMERHTLITLAHDPRSIARMKTILDTGKPLKN